MQARTEPRARALGGNAPAGATGTQGYPGACCEEEKRQEERRQRTRRGQGREEEYIGGGAPDV